MAGCDKTAEAGAVAPGTPNATNVADGDVTTELHETGGTIGDFVIAMHASAAPFHHCVVRDNTLRRMLPN